MDHDGVLAWVSDYERAWRDSDVYAVERLFAPDIRYRRSPYEPDDVGHQAVKTFWLEDQGQAFTLEAWVVSLEGVTAVVRVLVNYLAPTQQEYTDLWVLRFGDDGRVADFEEWACWPGKAFSAKDH